MPEKAPQPPKAEATNHPEDEKLINWQEVSETFDRLPDFDEAVAQQQSEQKDAEREEWLREEREKLEAVRSRLTRRNREQGINSIDENPPETMPQEEKPHHEPTEEVQKVGHAENHDESHNEEQQEHEPIRRDERPKNENKSSDGHKNPKIERAKEVVAHLSHGHSVDWMNTWWGEWFAIYPLAFAILPALDFLKKTFSDFQGVVNELTGKFGMKGGGGGGHKPAASHDDHGHGH